MGMQAGTELELLYKAPFGDPIAICMHGSMISLRLDEAKYIHVSSIPI
jgi:Fe2+ transport system protein FeoA